MSEDAAVTSRFRDYADSIGRFYPSFGSENKAVQACLLSKPLEFEGVKIGIVYYLPKAQQFYRITIPQPVLNNNINMLGIFIPSNIRKRNIITPSAADNRDFISLYVYLPVLHRLFPFLFFPHCKREYPLESPLKMYALEWGS